MAFPAIESTAGTNGSTAAASHAVTLPATISAGALLMVVGRVTGAGAVAVSGGGWTIAQDSSDASDDVTFWMYRDTLAAGTEDGSTITVTHGASLKLAAVALSITGAADPATQAPQSSTVAVGTSAGPDPTAATPTGGAKDYLWLWAGGWEGEQTSPPAGNVTNYALSKTGADTGTAGAVATNCRVMVVGRQLNAASENPGGLVISVGDDWTVWTLAVHPTGVQTKTLVATVETDAAQALSKTQAAQSKSLVATTGTNTAQALSKTQAAQSKSLVAAAETDAAQPLDFDLVSPDQHKTLVAATEADAAQALARTQAPLTRTIGQALETGSAQTLSFTQAAQTKTLVAAAEANAAQALSASQAAQTKNLAAAAEADAAQALAVTQDALERTLTPAAETDAAQTLALTQEAQEVTLGIVGETDAAVALTTGADIHADLTPAAEIDAARSLAFTQGPAQTVTISAATSSGVAVALTYSQAPLTRTLTPASELDTATALSVPGGAITILPATSTNQALALSYVGGLEPEPVTGVIAIPHTGHVTRVSQGRFSRIAVGRIDQPITGQIEEEVL